MPFVPDTNSGFIPDEPKERVPAAFAFARSLIDELTSPLPIRRIPEILEAKRALAGDQKAVKQIARREELTRLAEEQHPIASGLGRFGGILPAFAIAGGPAKALVSKVPALSRLPFAAQEAIRQGTQFGLAEAIQGRPSETPGATALGAALGPVTTIPRFLPRVATGATVMGGLSAATAPPGQRVQAGVTGAGLGAVGTAFPMRPEAPRPALRSTSGFIPESVWLNPRQAFPEEFTPQAAEAAARAGAEEMTRRQPTPTVELYRTAYGLKAFPKGEKGFVAIPEEGGGRQASRAAPIFYSHLERTLDERMPNAATPDQVRGILKNGGVNPSMRSEVMQKGQRRFGGFVALPEEEPLKQAAGQTARAGVVAAVSPASSERVGRLEQEIRQATPIRGEQEALYRKERSQRIARVLSTRERVGGEAGHYAELGQLKGELPKVEFEGVRSKFSQADVDALMNDVNAKLTGFDPINARTGLLKLLDGQVPTHSELDLLREVFGEKLVDAALSKRGASEQLGELALKILNSPKELSAGLGDMSGALRQAGFLARRHPVIWAKSVGKMVKQYFDSTYFKATQQAIRNDPAYPLAQQAKLRLTLPGASYGKGEETFQSGLFKNVPILKQGIGAANRAYSGILNNMSFEVFKKYVKLYQGDPTKLKGIANFINNATLRGDLRIPFVSSYRGGGPFKSMNEALQKSGPILNASLWSPRAVSSRLAIYSDPTYYLSLPKGVRIEAFKTLLIKSAADAAMLGLASALGLKVGDDIRSADFLKVKVGNTRFDFNGGASQNWVLMGRLLTGQMVNSVTGREFRFGEGYRATTALDVLQRYFGGKLSPVASLVMTALEGQGAYGGKPINWPAAVLDMYIPMFLDDIHETLQDREVVDAVVALGGINAFFGGGTQTYGRMVPNIEQTPMGRPTVRFRPTPTLGEKAVNLVTGGRPSNIPTRLHRPLSDLNLAMQRHKADVDKAKYQTAKDGKARRVKTTWGNTLIWMKNGEVKTSTETRRQRPDEAVAQLQREGQFSSAAPPNP